jgi:ribonuclease P protein component
LTGLGAAANKRRRETDVSTTSQAAKAHARFSQAHAYARRAPSAQTPSQKGPLASHGHRAQEVAGRPAVMTSRRLEGQSLPAAGRLRARGDFIRVQRRGHRFDNGAAAGFFASVGPGLGRTTRLGITVTKRVGGAVVRNRVKRLVREAFRWHRALLGPAQRDIVVIARPQAAQMDSSQITAELVALFARIGAHRAGTTR